MEEVLGGSERCSGSGEVLGEWSRCLMAGQGAVVVVEVEGGVQSVPGGGTTCWTRVRIPAKKVSGRVGSGSKGLTLGSGSGLFYGNKAA